MTVARSRLHFSLPGMIQHRFGDRCCQMWRLPLHAHRHISLQVSIIQRYDFKPAGIVQFLDLTYYWVTTFFTSTQTVEHCVKAVGMVEKLGSIQILNVR